MSAKPKKKITTWSFGDKLSFPVDADESWKDFTGSNFDDQTQFVSECFFWQIQLPWIDLPEDTLKRFWNEFQKKDAKEARTVAVHGIPFANKSGDLDLLNDAIIFQRDLTAGRFKGADNEETFRSAAIRIALRFAEIAGKNDHRHFQRLADIIKAGGIDPGTKGGESSFNGKVIRIFCQLVVASRTLPTKKQLREALGIGAKKSEAEEFRRAIKELGLGGLPTAK